METGGWCERLSPKGAVRGRWRRGGGRSPSGGLAALGLESGLDSRLRSCKTLCLGSFYIQNKERTRQNESRRNSRRKLPLSLSGLAFLIN